MDRNPPHPHSAVIVSAIPGLHLGLRMQGDHLTALDFVADATPLRAPRDASTQRAAASLTRYFATPTTRHSAPPLTPAGTPFQQRVWAALRAIPPGAPISYAALAHHLATSPRAIGGACRANPIPILIPCHRVISAHGLGGFMGATEGPAMDIKRWLLRHEGYADARR